MLYGHENRWHSCMNLMEICSRDREELVVGWKIWGSECHRYFCSPMFKKHFNNKCRERHVCTSKKVRWGSSDDHFCAMCPLFSSCPTDFPMQRGFAALHLYCSYWVNPIPWGIFQSPEQVRSEFPFSLSLLGYSFTTVQGEEDHSARCELFSSPQPHKSTCIFLSCSYLGSEEGREMDQRVDHVSFQQNPSHQHHRLRNAWRWGQDVHFPLHTGWLPPCKQRLSLACRQPFLWRNIEAPTAGVLWLETGWRNEAVIDCGAGPIAQSHLLAKISQILGERQTVPFTAVVCHRVNQALVGDCEGFW